MKYTTPYAELVALEAVSVILASGESGDECPEYFEMPDCEVELPGV